MQVKVTQSKFKEGTIFFRKTIYKVRLDVTFLPKEVSIISDENWGDQILIPRTLRKDRIPPVPASEWEEKKDMYNLRLRDLIFYKEDEFEFETQDETLAYVKEVGLRFGQLKKLLVERGAPAQTPDEVFIKG